MTQNTTKTKTVLLCAPFYATGSFTAATFNIRGQVADPNNTYSISTSSLWFAHLGDTTYIQGNAYPSLANTLWQFMFDNASGPNSYQWNFNRRTRRFEITGSTTEFTASFIGCEGLGFSGIYRSVPSTGTTQTIQGAPVSYYMFEASEGEVGGDTLEFEDTPITSERVADDGTSYAISRGGIYQARDFDLVFEPTENVFKSSWQGSSNTVSGTSMPWEKFLGYVRQSNHPVQMFRTTDNYLIGGRPAYLQTGSGDLHADPPSSSLDMICKFRGSEGFQFRPEKVEDDWDEYWNIGVKTRRVDRY